MHVGGVHFGAWTLGCEVHGNAFVWLDAERDHVALDLMVLLMGEEGLRCALEVNSNFCQVS